MSTFILIFTACLIWTLPTTAVCSTDPLTNLKSGVRFLRRILNDGTRASSSTILFLPPLLEVLKLRPYIASESTAIYDILGNAEEHICFMAKKTMNRFTCSTNEVEGISMAMKAQIEVTGVKRKLKSYQRSSNINECKWAKKKNFETDDEEVNKYIQTQIKSLITCRF